MDLHELLERSDRVFPAYPLVGRYFPAASIESARRRLARSIKRGEGPGVVIGGAGTGKSLLLQVLAAQFQQQFDVVLLASAQLCTRRALLQSLHFELGLDHRHRDEGQLRLNLAEQLLAVNQEVAGLLLLVDEAQALPIPLLEELRVLTNLVRGGVPGVRLVLAGLPSLEEQLASPELESFSQRLASRCYLSSMTRQETAQYVQAQAVAADIDPQRLFVGDATTAVFEATDGVPRLVNQLCDRALTIAAERDAASVDRSLIQAAWADLQQLPLPWDAMPTAPASESPETSSAGVVEFGALDTEPVQSTTIDDADAEPATDATADVPAPSPSAVEEPAQPAIDAQQDEPQSVLEPTELDDELDDDDQAPPSAMSTLLAPPPAAAESAEAAVEAEESPECASATTSPTTGSPAPPPSPSSPRVFRGIVPDAVDPFTDDFDEVELVLDNFAALSGILHENSPQVENRSNPAFSQMLDAALAPPSAAAPVEPPEENIRDRPPSPLPATARRPSIRLAVVDEAGDQEAGEDLPEELPEGEARGIQPESRETSGDVPTAEGEVVATGPEPARPLDPLPAEQPSSPAESDRPWHRSTVCERETAVAAVDAPAELHGFAGRQFSEQAQADTVLIIDDEPPLAAAPGVRREEYRQLFSRLKQGT